MDKNGQKWTKMDKIDPNWTKLGKYCQEETKINKNGEKYYRNLQTCKIFRLNGFEFFKP